MSCIPKILELKADQEILRIPMPENSVEKCGLVIEDGGHYKGYDYIITFNDMGFRCGYVAIPATHPMHSFKNPEYNYPSYSVHGGVTFFEESHLSEALLGEHTCNDKWVGFDAGHAWDRSDLECFNKYFPDYRPSRKDYVVMNSTDRWGDGKSEVRTKGYMIDECKSLIDQLIEEEEKAA